MLLVIDKYIPFPDSLPIEGLKIVPMEPEKITPETIRYADALFVRTRTKVDEALLADSTVQFVATATIGYDHIDTAYCESHGIEWISCPGCNAQAVCDFVEAILDHVATLKPLSSHSQLGVVGVGHIGSLVAQMAERKGLDVLLNDPPKNIGVSLDEIAENCDIITFHTPITFAPNPYPTFHLCDEAFLRRCKPDALIINAARGGIIDEQALLKTCKKCVIDCWENEPNINKELLLSPQTILASYHIAGYSQQGKINASQMCLDGFCKHFRLSALTIEKNSLPLHAENKGDSQPGWLKRITEQLKANPDNFEQLRKQYKLR